MSLVLWTIRASLVVSFASLGIQVWVRSPNDRADRLRRWLWLVAAVIYLLHVSCAFHFVHAWSHARALHETARQTEEFTGWQFGGGLYLNYLLTLIWPADAFCQCFAPRTDQREQI